MHRVSGVFGNETERCLSQVERFALGLAAPVHFPQQATCQDSCQDSDRVSAAARFGGSHLSCRQQILPGTLATHHNRTRIAT